MTDDAGDQGLPPAVRVFGQAPVHGGIDADPVAAQPRNHSCRSSDGGSRPGGVPASASIRDPNSAHLSTTVMLAAHHRTASRATTERTEARRTWAGSRRGELVHAVIRSFSGIQRRG